MKYRVIGVEQSIGCKFVGRSQDPNIDTVSASRTMPWTTALTMPWVKSCSDGTQDEVGHRPAVAPAPAIGMTTS